jgi:hypothetical protein
MTQPPFWPILYLKDTCPHCLKLRLFLLEAGLLDGFEQRISTQGNEVERAIREELAPHFDKVTFPTVQHAPGGYMQDSDAIIAHYGCEAGIDPAALGVFTAYARFVLPKYMEARRKLAVPKQSA